MADRDSLVPMVTLADDRPAVRALVGALAASVERRRGTPRPGDPSGWDVEPGPVLPARARPSSPGTSGWPIGEAVGRTCAELVAPYPPGIPVLAPGEEVTRSTRWTPCARPGRAGTRIAYAADPGLRTVTVVAG